MNFWFDKLELDIALGILDRKDLLEMDVCVS